jgi:hypothetical protein
MWIYFYKSIIYITIQEMAIKSDPPLALYMQADYAAESDLRAANQPNAKLHAGGIN